MSVRGAVEGTANRFWSCMIWLGIAGLALVIVSYAFGWADRELNYKPVQAQVVRVSDHCKLVRPPRTSRPEPELACADAQRLHESDPQFRAHRIERHRMLEVAYVSPADGQRHSAAMDHVRDGQYEGAAAGDTIEVLAHESEPGSVQAR